METWQGKKVIVLGLARSGCAAARALKALGAEVYLTDKKSDAQLEKEKKSLEKQGITVELGGHSLNWLDKADLLVVSPGVPLTVPYLVEAKKRGITLMSELEIAWRLAKAPFLAVTGTNGKTTTTTLVGEIVKQSGREVLVGGNIGVPLVDKVASLPQSGAVVAEVSSFQLETVIDFAPHISGILNITEDHLDRHKTMENYRAIKSRIFSRQTASDVAVLNADDPLVVSLAEEAPGRVVFFSQQKEVAGVYALNGEIFSSLNGRPEKICDRSEIKLKGPHNLENALCALAMGLVFGIAKEKIVEVLNTFSGVEHRLEFSGEKNGVRFYNDSKATNPDAVIKALQSFAEPIILIAGGRDKGVSYAEMMSLAKEKVKELILIGEAADLIEKAALGAGMMNIHRAESMAEAVKRAFELACPGEVVLLSPACASFDMFLNYEVRGEVFKEAVLQLA